MKNIRNKLSFEEWTPYRWPLCKIIRPKLKKSPITTIVKALSHGITHFILFVLTIFAVVVLWPQNSDAQKVDIRDLSISLDTKSYDTLTSLKIVLHLDSEEIKHKTNGKYKDELNVSFSYDIKNPEKMDTTKIDLLNYPPLNDIYCYQDSIIYYHVSKDIHIDKYTRTFESVYIPLVYKTHLHTTTEIIDSLNRSLNRYRYPYRYTFLQGENFYKDTLRLKDGDSITYNNNLIEEAERRINEDSSTYHIHYDWYKPDKKGKKREKFTASIFPADNLLLPSGRYIASSQNIHFLSNNLGLQDNNCYYNYHISLPYFPIATNTSSYINYYSNCTIEILIGDFDVINGAIHNSNKDIMINNIYPMPDQLQNGRIFYYTEDKIDEIRDNGGIILYAEDINMKNKKNRSNLIKSVFTGTAIAIAFDVFIQLIKELRTLNKMRRKDDDDDELIYDDNNESDNYTTIIT